MNEFDVRSAYVLCERFVYAYASSYCNAFQIEIKLSIIIYRIVSLMMSMIFTICPQLIIMMKKQFLHTAEQIIHMYVLYAFVCMLCTCGVCISSIQCLLNIIFFFFSYYYCCSFYGGNAETTNNNKNSNRSNDSTINLITIVEFPVIKMYKYKEIRATKIMLCWVARGNDKY